MHVVNDVRRRLIESTCRDVIEQAVPLKIFSRTTIVAGLVLCNGSIEQFNKHYNEWRHRRARAAIVVTLGPKNDDVHCDDEPHFLDFVRSRQPETIDSTNVSDSELLERHIEVSVIQRQMPRGFVICYADAARALMLCDGNMLDTIAILKRALIALDTGGQIGSQWLLWNVARMYRDRWASLREDWRAPKEVLNAR